MNKEQRKSLLGHLDNVLGYSIESNGTAETIRDIRPDVLHTWLLLSILDRLESIDESLIVLAQAKEQGHG